MLELQGEVGESHVELTSKRTPSIHTHHDPPLVHLPLQMPHTSSTSLTPWVEVLINLNTLLPLFHQLPNLSQPMNEGHNGFKNDDHGVPQMQKAYELPDGRLGSITYVRVYGNCRLRRIWFVCRQAFQCALS